MIHRRTFCKALAASPVLATPMLLRSAFADEVSSIVLISQTGLPYLPMMVMEHFKLIEKHAEKLGVASLKPEFKSMGGTQSLIDAQQRVDQRLRAAHALELRLERRDAQLLCMLFDQFEVLHHHHRQIRQPGLADQHNARHFVGES